MDPLDGSPWSKSETVQGCTRSAPNATLLAFADAELHRRGGHGRLLDIGCGAGRNAVPLARLGWKVLGVDLSLPMIAAAASRIDRTVELGRLDQFSGDPQCFLTEQQLLVEMRARGFAPDPDVPLRELNRPRSAMLATAGTPVIYEAVFRRNDEVLQ